MHRHCTGHKQSMNDNFEKTLERLKTDYIEGSGDKLNKIYEIIERILIRHDGRRKLGQRGIGVVETGGRAHGFVLVPSGFGLRASGSAVSAGSTRPACAKPRARS